MANADDKNAQPSDQPSSTGAGQTKTLSKVFDDKFDHLIGQEMVKVRVNGPELIRLDPETGRVKSFLRDSETYITRAELDAINDGSQASPALVEVKDEDNG